MSLPAGMSCNSRTVLFAVCVCCLLSDCLLSVVCCLLSCCPAVCCLLSVVCCLLSVVCCLLSCCPAVCCLLSVVCCTDWSSHSRNARLHDPSTKQCGPHATETTLGCKARAVAVAVAVEYAVSQFELPENASLGQQRQQQQQQQQQQSRQQQQRLI